MANDLREVVRDLHAGKLDELPVYRKSLGKAPEAYTATRARSPGPVLVLLGQDGADVSGSRKQFSPF